MCLPLKSVTCVTLSNSITFHFNESWFIDIKLPELHLPTLFALSTIDIQGVNLGWQEMHMSHCVKCSKLHCMIMFHVIYIWKSEKVGESSSMYVVEAFNTCLPYHF